MTAPKKNPLARIPLPVIAAIVGVRGALGLLDGLGLLSGASRGHVDWGVVYAILMFAAYALWRARSWARDVVFAFAAIDVIGGAILLLARGSAAESSFAVTALGLGKLLFACLVFVGLSRAGSRDSSGVVDPAGSS